MNRHYRPPCYYQFYYSQTHEIFLCKLLLQRSVLIVILFLDEKLLLLDKITVTVTYKLISTSK